MPRTVAPSPPLRQNAALEHPPATGGPQRTAEMNGWGRIGAPHGRCPARRRCRCPFYSPFVICVVENGGKVMLLGMPGMTSITRKS